MTVSTTGLALCMTQQERLEQVGVATLCVVFFTGYNVQIKVLCEVPLINSLFLSMRRSGMLKTGHF